MSWLDCFFTPHRRIRTRAERRRSCSRHRRRIAAPEGLEARTVLSSVTTPPGFISGALTITADKFDNRFSIAEFRDGGVSKVTITALDAATLINGGASWTSLGAVGSIVVNLQSGTVADHDVIQLSGEGKGVAQGTKNVTFNVGKTSLDLTVTDINNAGAFKLTTQGRLGLVMDAARWNSLSITQSGCCPANVEISDSTVSGNVTVKEGWGDGSSIVVDNSQFGATVLSQYSGKKHAGPDCEGDGDVISVTASQVLTLDINQCDGDGAANSVTVEEVVVAQSNGAYFGISICQGDGDSDSVLVNEIGVYGRPNLRSAPTAGIEVVQGCGANITAQVSNAIVPGDVTIVQGCGEPCDGVLTPSGISPWALIENVAAGLTGSFAAGEMSITQGDAKDSEAYISGSSTAALDIVITQGDGELDTAAIADTSSGRSMFITQGAAYYTGDPKKDPHGGDIATIGNSSARGRVEITQCDVANPVLPEDVPLPAGNLALIDTVDAFGSVTIFQGDKDGDTAKILTSTTYRDIRIHQEDGDGDTAIIDSSATLFEKNGDGRMSIDQGDGDGDTAVIRSSTSYGFILIGQGDGDGDDGSILDSTAGSFARVAQGDGDDDVALISGVSARVGLDITQGDGGDGDGDCVGDVATIEDSITERDVLVTQGDGDFDEIYILGLTAGTVDWSGGFPKDVLGSVYLTQGDGYADLIVVEGGSAGNTTINNLTIFQGNSVPFDGCEALPCRQNDTIQIGNTDITSDLSIHQGGVAAFGDYVVEIGLGGPVTAYGYTSILQSGEANTVLMFDFITTWLDVRQGDGGGAYAEVGNTTVDYGAYPAEFCFNAGGEGNTFVDDGGNTNVSFSDNYNVIP